MGPMAEPYRIWLMAALATICLLAYSLAHRKIEWSGSAITTETRDRVLNGLRDALAKEYGYLNGGPRINQGPCAAFAVAFQEEWNRRFKRNVSLWVVFAQDRSKAFHVMIRLPDGSAYDGGRGVMPPIMTRRLLSGDILEEFKQADIAMLEKHFGSLGRRYPRCPSFDLSATRRLISDYLDQLVRKES